MTTVANPNKSHPSPAVAQLKADILAMLAAGPKTVHDLQEHLAASETGIDRALKLLRQEGAIEFGRVWGMKRAWRLKVAA